MGKLSIIYSGNIVVSVKNGTTITAAKPLYAAIHAAKVNIGFIPILT